MFFEVSEGDIGVPPVGHGVVEDPVEGGKVCRGGEGGAAVVVARCLSPNNSPHLGSADDWREIILIGKLFMI